MDRASTVLSEDRDEEGLGVWALRVADIDSSQLDLSVLDAGERRRAATLVHGADRLSYIAGRILLRELLGRRLGLASAGVAFRRELCPSCGGPNGRPALDGDARSPHFSISRSGGVVLIAIAAVPVGVDVQIFPHDETPSEVSSLLHAEERSEIASAAPSKRTEVFTRLWTRKEAYLKGIGTGVAHDLDAEYLGTRPHGAAPPDWTVLDLPVAAGYAAAAAIKRRQSSV